MQLIGIACLAALAIGAAIYTSPICQPGGAEIRVGGLLMGGCTATSRPSLELATNARSVCERIGVPDQAPRADCAAFFTRYPPDPIEDIGQLRIRWFEHLRHQPPH